MAKFEMELPNDLIKELENLETNTQTMMEEMTQAGAKKVKENVKNNMKKSFSDSSKLEKYIFVTRAYKTSNGFISSKVGFSGYFTNKQGRSVAIPLVLLAREYGTSNGEAKKPFFRKSFKQSQIEMEMEKVQDKYLPKE